MKKERLLSLVSLLVVLAVWALASGAAWIHEDSFPSLSQFVLSLKTEILSGRLITDIIASLFRWSSGFFLAVLVGVPAGLLLGRSPGTQVFLAPYLSFFRSLSPLVWIPFAVIWFGIGDLPVVFLIFLGCVFPLLFTTVSAVLSVPKIYDDLAMDYHFYGVEYFFEILLPAVLPQIIASLRLVAGLAWIILVPAEMLAGKEGVGFAILDARNGMRTDLLVLNMLTIGLIGNLIDHGLQYVDAKSKVRWGHGQ